ncbi:MAG TPA: hypothetical protein VHU83_06560 [Bryobacteraceae bacterium]|nr:hypothetical protein [Bryobacteraceae bacterium]
MKSSVPAIAIKPVRKAGRLAYVNLIETVSVNVPHGHAVMAVDIDTACAV